MGFSAYFLSRENVISTVTITCYRLLSLLPRMSCFIIDFDIELFIKHDLTVLMLAKNLYIE